MLPKPTFRETFVSKGLPKDHSPDWRIAIPALVPSWNRTFACIGRNTAPDQGFGWFPFKGGGSTKMC
jgi:hypothetical protein